MKRDFVIFVLFMVGVAAFFWWLRGVMERAATLQTQVTELEHRVFELERDNIRTTAKLAVRKRIYETARRWIPWLP